MTKLMQYNTRAASHVTSKNRSTKPMMAIALAHASTMLTEVLKCSSSLLLMVLVSCCMTWQNTTQASNWANLRQMAQD